MTFHTARAEDHLLDVLEWEQFLVERFEKKERGCKSILQQYVPTST